MHFFIVNSLRCTPVASSKKQQELIFLVDFQNRYRRVSGTVIITDLKFTLAAGLQITHQQEELLLLGVLR